MQRLKKLQELQAKIEACKQQQSVLLAGASPDALDTLVRMRLADDSDSPLSAFLKHQSRYSVPQWCYFNSSNYA